MEGGRESENLAPSLTLLRRACRVLDPMNIDLSVTLIILGALAFTAVSYALRVALIGPVHFARVEARGGSPLLGRHALRMGYWGLQPVARACTLLGLTADAITESALVLAAAAGVALSLGHLGLGGALATVASLGDALDGLVARATKTETRRGAVFDAAADRYGEFFIVGGLALHFHESLLALALALVALIGSFMVSYGSAKAEAAGMTPPRGAMRRAERAACLCVGALLSPIVGAMAPASVPWLTAAPPLAALALVGVIANVSAVRRLGAVGRHGEARSPTRTAAPTDGAVVPSAALRADATRPAPGL